jgi:HrpA-like RNA helicase
LGAGTKLRRTGFGSDFISAIISSRRRPGICHSNHIPLPLLNQVEEAGFEWQIPGLRRELIIALIKSQTDS